MPNLIPFNPKLPKNFDSTPNEQRSKAQLDAWWDRPFAIAQETSRIEVRCLNGGAWDRTTWLGTADTYEEACAIAEKKQAEWVEHRAHPVVHLGDKIDIVRMPQRPDQDMTVLASFDTHAEAISYMEQNFPTPL